MEIGKAVRTTFIIYVDKYDQLLSKKQVPPDRTFHLKHPELVPDGAVAYRYYDHTTERSFNNSVHNNTCNHSEWMRLEQLINAS